MTDEIKKQDLNDAIYCEVTGDPFYLNSIEQQFYDKNSLPQPSVSPEIRQKYRLKISRNRSLHERKCDKCDKVILSVYDENEPFPVYCQTCYWKYLEEK